MQTPSFQDKRITVFGLGSHSGGLGTVEFLARHGAREVIVTDIRKREEFGPQLRALSRYRNITYVLGQHRPEDFTRVNLVVKNPAIPWTNEYVRLAEKSGVSVGMDSGLFFAACRAPIIGVTGSKGKTTTASLIAHLLERAGRPVVRAGIGQIGVLGVFDQIRADSTVVFELSSWRLSALGRIRISPHIAVLTNLYPDHLNYYPSMEVYIADKKQIFLHQRSGDFLIANADDERVREAVQDAPATLIWFSPTGEIDGDGVWIRDGMIMARRGGRESGVLPVGRVPSAGRHHLADVLAAVAATLAAGLAVKEIAAGLSDFAGVPHRLESVGSEGGVRFVNDTAATIPEAAIAALQTFREPVILIAGGSDKRLNFEAFAREIAARAKGVVLLKGDGTDRLIAALRATLPEADRNFPFVVVESMAKAVEVAFRSADPGDVVLLSPGMASFGLFKNEFDRGDQFRHCVQGLSAREGAQAA